MRKPDRAVYLAAPLALAGVLIYQTHPFTQWGNLIWPGDGIYLNHAITALFILVLWPVFAMIFRKKLANEARLRESTEAPGSPGQPQLQESPTVKEAKDHP